MWKIEREKNRKTELRKQQLKQQQKQPIINTIFFVDNSCKWLSFW